MDWLYSLLDNSSVPVVTALILGILTAVSPCPLATNLTAVAYLGREIDNRRKVFYLGLLYTLGRTIAYSALGAVLIFIIRKGEDAFDIQDAISAIGEWILGPALVLIGLFMLFGHLLHLPKFGFSGQASGSWTQGALGALILGVLFAMAFCPTSGMPYFGMLIPMSAVESGGYVLPRGLCHRHLPSCARCCMDYSLQHAVVRQGDGQDSRLPALVQPFRSHPLHPCRLILYCHNYFITFIKKHL